MSLLVSASVYAQDKPTRMPAAASDNIVQTPVAIDHNNAPNYTSFPQRQKRNLAAWGKYNDKDQCDHPEFGILPDGAPNDHCVELLSRRTANERYFKDIVDTGKIYIQQSLDPINVLREGHWLSLSTALHEAGPGKYAAAYHSESVSIDLARKEIAIQTLAGKVSFNNWSLWARRNGWLVRLAAADWSHFTIGEDGMYVTNLFKGIDAEFRVLRGAVKTNLVIRSSQYGPFEALIFRDDFNQGNGTRIAFNGDASMKKGTGSLTVYLGDQDVLKVGEAVAYPKYAGKHKAFGVAYALDGKGLDIIVPAAAVNANLKNDELVIDPLVTATNTLAQSAITGSNRIANGSCGFGNFCSYNLTVPQPAATTITDITTTFGYLASGLCSTGDGAMQFLLGSCVSPGAGIIWYCAGSGGGSCGFDNGSMYSYFRSCIPAPSCNSQNLSFALRLFRSCKGVNGCDGSCIGAATPWTITLTCHSVEFTNPANPADPIVVTGSTCEGQPVSAQVTGSGGVPPYSYQWSFNPSGTPVQSTSNSLALNFPTAGNYPVYATITDACNNIFQASKTITINAPKTADDNVTICAAQLPYTWNGQTIAAGGTAVATYTTPSKLTGCDSTTTLNLTVNTSPAVGGQPANATIFVNGNANFTVTATGTAPTYQWQVNTGSGFGNVSNGGVYSGSTSASLVITGAPLSMNGYTYRCLVSGACPPAVTSNQGVLTVKKYSQTISFNPPVSGGTVVHTYGDAPFSTAATASSGLPVTYSSSNPAVAVIDASGQTVIKGAGTTLVTVSQAGDGSYLAAPDATLTVQIDKKDLRVTAEDKTRPYGESNPPLSMQYSGFVYGEDQSVITEPVVSTAVVLTTQPGAYPIVLTGGSAANYNLILTNGTFTVKGAVVFIDRQPDNNSACAGGKARFSTLASAASPIVTPGYQWQQSANGSTWQDITGAGMDTMTISNTNTVYIRCLITAPGTKMYTQTVVFTVNPLPGVRAAKSNDLDCNLGSANLLATGAGYYNWAPATGLSDSHIPNPVARPSGDITYVVTGIDANGCMNSDSIEVKVTTVREGENVMANAFTPNGDGKNDCFGIRYWGVIQSIEFDIYDRNGMLVFHSTRPGDCWDGRYKGQGQPTGTYIYSIRAATTCGVINRKGTVILIR